jgi:aminoglycoside phosphotransferase (APT) family kinase protein
VPPLVRRWISAQVGSEVVAVRRLAGASSTAVHGVRLADGSRLALRRYVWPGFLESEPDAPAREVDALQFARAAGLPVPEVVAADVAGADIGDGIPALVMTFVPGRAVAVPDLHRLAETAAAIHAVPAASLGHEYFPWYADTTVGPPPASTRPGLWERAIDAWHHATPAYEPSFIHRDFHPGNVLWSRGSVTGIVDWANACRGPWGCDVAHCRGNLVDLGGQQAADQFLAAYESVTGKTYDPFWEIASVLEHGPSWWTDEELAASEPRLERALAAR